MTVVRQEARPGGWLARLRAVRREALGMNRRNLTFMVPYNARPLFALVDQKQVTKQTLAAVGIPVPETYAELAMLWDVRRLAHILEGRSEFVIKPARGSGGGGVQVIAGRRGGQVRSGFSGATRGTAGHHAAASSEVFLRKRIGRSPAPRFSRRGQHG